jgi:MHS family proline/betaine transporter-like MFS transporter
MVLAPIVGIISDRYGFLKVMRAALVAVALTTYPLFLMLVTWPSVATLMFVQAITGILLAAVLAPVPALLSDIFPTATRGTGLALSYNVTATIFGGFSPLIVTILIDSLQNKLAPSFYVMATAALSILAVVMLARRQCRAHILHA